ncbi:hypothetical protein [Psychroserpens ponticola]|uniref:DUF3570 domain-containing protein n=1 Tax=Psychroserpens ponticola TaxID=2932268 RepID=A0ABY7RUD0_9FLAO|nr:hypothetical protein [Psychroserpens ponticola]WCO00573.1 hypothetical protein MUN68_010885 [Psychroserpens ponticola]
MKISKLTIALPMMCLINSFVIAQNDTLISRDKIDLKQIKHEETIYNILQKSWIANQEVSYLSILPLVSSVSDRRIPLINGEGNSSNNYLMEANINLSFPLFFGRNTGYQSYKRNKITFDYNGTFRMTLDDSKPLTPGNNKVGFSWYLSLYNNYTGWVFGKDQTPENQMINSKTENLKFVNTLLRVHHYSNGQPPGFYYYPDDNDLTSYRNSYLDGDFSTNYIYLEATKGTYVKSIGSLRQISLGYRYDFGDDTSALAYSKEQEDTYGRHRVLLKYDYRTKRLAKRFEHHARIDFEYILDNLDKFSPNLINDNNKYRLGVKGLFEIAPKNHRAIGYFISAYYGRDYLNIRYDDIIYSIQTGITLSLDKFSF